jgi:Tol biopolymer transport system component
MRKCALFTLPLLFLFLTGCADQATAPDVDLTASFAKGGKPSKPGGDPPAPPNPAIAYSDGGLWVADEDGSNKTLIFDPDLGGWNVQPAWSPLGDGTEANPYRIFFTTTGWQHNVGKVTFYYEEGTLQVLPVEELAPDAYWTGVAVSPNGESLVVSKLGESSEVLLTSTTFSGLTTIFVSDPGVNVFEVTWSGDGTKVAFFEESETLILTIVDVSDPSFPVVKELDLFGGGSIEGLDWARHSNSLVYNLDGTMYLLDLDGNLDPVGPPESLGEGRGPVWSPDDTRVLYYMRRFYIKTIGASGKDKRLPMGGRWQDWRRNPPQ